MDILVAKNLSKSYGRKVALDNVNLTFTKGKIIGLLGPNGSGKTTFIKIINNLLQPSSGEITINGFKPGIETKKVISYLPDSSFLDANFKVSEAINYFMDFFDDFDSYKAYELLKKVDIDPEVRLKTLSKGNNEKVQLILTMSRTAILYVLDEPIGGVDPASRDLILDLILNNVSENSTVLMSTHLISEIEQYLDEVVLINKGVIISHKDTDSLRQEYNKSIDAIFREEFKCY